MGLAPNLNERSYFLMSAIRLETDDMPIEHILGHIGNEVMQWTIAQLSPKAPNEWTQIEHNMCIERPSPVHDLKLPAPSDLGLSSTSWR